MLFQCSENINIIVCKTKTIIIVLIMLRPMLMVVDSWNFLSVHNQNKLRFTDGSDQRQCTNDRDFGLVDEDIK